MGARRGKPFRGPPELPEPRTAGRCPNVRQLGHCPFKASSLPLRGCALRVSTFGPPRLPRCMWPPAPEGS
eukprot:8863520-Heterocapsa_arctica.AAC.1